jgi:hypothetical protein
MIDRPADSPRPCAPNFSRGVRMEAAERKLFIKMNTWSSHSFLDRWGRRIKHALDSQTILMGISVPECEGVQASLTPRTDPDIRDVAIIAFNALDPYEVRRHLVDHEFDGYCQKGPTVIPLAAFKLSCRKTNEQPRAMKTSSCWVYAAIR